MPARGWGLGLAPEEDLVQLLALVSSLQVSGSTARDLPQWGSHDALWVSSPLQSQVWALWSLVLLRAFLPPSAAHEQGRASCCPVGSRGMNVTVPCAGDGGIFTSASHLGVKIALTL